MTETSASSTNNLSEEEKLWQKRNHVQKKVVSFDKNQNDKNMSKYIEVSVSRRMGSSKNITMGEQGRNNDNVNPTVQINCHTINNLSYSSTPSLVWSVSGLHLSPFTRICTEKCKRHSWNFTVVPEIPYNSIAHIDSNFNISSSIHHNCSVTCFQSSKQSFGAYNSDIIETAILTPSMYKNENLIVSNGITNTNFKENIFESHSHQRRTKPCPIVKGDSACLDFETTQLIHNTMKPALQVNSQILDTMSPGITIWVVNMSNCTNLHRKSFSGTTNVIQRKRNHFDSTNAHKTGCYKPLGNMNKKRGKVKYNNVTSQMNEFYNAPPSANIYINLSKGKYKQKNSELISTIVKDKNQVNKKNIFNMCIAFNDVKTRKSDHIGPSKHNNFHRTINSIMSSKYEDRSFLRTIENSMDTSKVEHNRKSESNENEFLQTKINIDPLIRLDDTHRTSEQKCVRNGACKRHPLSNTTIKENLLYECKKSASSPASLGDKRHIERNFLYLIDKRPLSAKIPSLAVLNPLPKLDSVGSLSNFGSSVYNNCDIELVNTEQEARTKNYGNDMQSTEISGEINVTFKANHILQNAYLPSQITDTAYARLPQNELLKIHELSIHEQLQQLHIPNHAAFVMEATTNTKEIYSPGHNIKVFQATIDKQKIILETVHKHKAVDKSHFVKLADMDKPMKLDFQYSNCLITKKVASDRHNNRLLHDEVIVNSHCWSMSCFTFLNITTSVDNMRSLSRIFPNVSRKLYNSLPNEIILSQVDSMKTDMNAESNTTSSFSHSSIDESSNSYRQPRRLGEDLLKMFLEEIATDMVVEVHGRHIKTHKCILRARCQYFAAMLAGNRSQAVVSLEGYSFSAVHFALCHIYSGASPPSDGISLIELAALADLLGLEGLKEVTAHELKTNYCHNFHKPCTRCIIGVLQVLPIALNHALDDLYRKCLHWTCRFYIKVWQTRQFAQLPADVLSRCRQQIIANLTPETVLDTLIDCDDLLDRVASFQWGVICENLVHDVLDTAYTFILEHFASLIASDSFLSLGHDRSCYISRLKGILLRSASSLTPEQSCRSYQRITRLHTVLQANVVRMPANVMELANELKSLQEEELDWDGEFILLVYSIVSNIEQCLVRQYSHAMRIAAWQRMDLNLRKRIQSLANLSQPIGFHPNKPISKTLSFAGPAGNHGLQQIKLTMQAYTKGTLPHDLRLYKNTQTQYASHLTIKESEVQNKTNLRKGGKLTKSNVQEHVQADYIEKGKTSLKHERKSIISPRRNIPANSALTVKNNYQVKQKSPDIKTESPKQKLQSKVVNVHSRYLQYRNLRQNNSKCPTGFKRDVSSSKIPTMKGKINFVSSSDNLQTCTLAALTNVSNKIKTTVKSTNSSMGDLTILSNKNQYPKRRCCDIEVSNKYVDSMAKAMSKLAMTNKAISQENLRNPASLNQSQPLNITHIPIVKNNITKTRDKAIEYTKVTPITFNTSKYLKQQNITSAHSSLYSYCTWKSPNSHLRSASAIRSSCNSLLQKPTSTLNDQKVRSTTNLISGQRRSFLTAKSREILAKRAQKNNNQQFKKEQVVETSADKDEGPKIRNGQMRSASMNSTTRVQNCNFRLSNLPTHRPKFEELREINSSIKIISVDADDYMSTNCSTGTSDKVGYINMKIFPKDVAVMEELTENISFSAKMT